MIRTGWCLSFQLWYPYGVSAVEGPFSGEIRGRYILSKIYLHGPDLRSVYRRGLLQAMGTSAIALGSGCLDSFGSRPRYLESVNVRNHDETANEFELSIEQSGEIIQETTIELDRSEMLDGVDCQWSGRGPFEVTCMLSGDQTETIQVADIQEGAGEYAHITFVATSLGELSSSSYLDDGGVRRYSSSPSG